MKYISNVAVPGLLAAALAFGVVFAFAPVASAQSSEDDSAESSAIAAMLEQIQQLQELIQSLQAQLNEVRGQVRDLLKSDLREGMTDEDIEKVQELLATDPTIYPEGLVTGYFGPLTRGALMRFQERHGIPATGAIDEETEELLEEYLKEGFGDDIPPGLLRAPGIQKKVREGLCDDDDRRGRGPLCKDFRGDDDDEDDEDEEMDDEAEDEFEVEVEVENDETELSFTFEGDTYNVTVNSTDEDDVLEAVADELGVDVEDLDEDLADEIKDELEDAIEDAKDAFDVTVDVVDGTTTVEFTVDETEYEVEVDSTDEDDVLEAVADELGVDVEDLDAQLESVISEELADELS